MFDFPIYTSISNLNQLDHLVTFTTSFTKIHKFGHIVCVLDGVSEKDCISLPRLKYTTKLPEQHMYVATTNIFLDKVYTLYNFITSGVWSVHLVDSDVNDFVITKTPSANTLQLNPDMFIANFNITQTGVNTQTQYESLNSQLSRAITINTKSFQPYLKDINFHWNLFPWNLYHDILVDSKEHVSSEFYNIAMSNCIENMR